jgi:hypothetical protein
VSHHSVSDSISTRSPLVFKLPIPSNDSVYRATPIQSHQTYTLEHSLSDAKPSGVCISVNVNIIFQKVNPTRLT